MQHDHVAGSRLLIVAAVLVHRGRLLAKGARVGAALSLLPLVLITPIAVVLILRAGVRKMECESQAALNSGSTCVRCGMYRFMRMCGVQSRCSTRYRLSPVPGGVYRYKQRVLLMHAMTKAQKDVADASPISAPTATHVKKALTRKLCCCEWVASWMTRVRDVAEVQSRYASN